MAGDKLDKLREKRDALNARIQQELNRENARKRKADTRRKILAGAAVLDEAGKHPKYKAELFKLLDSFLARPDDRALFGLEPLADGKDGSARAEKAARVVGTVIPHPLTSNWHITRRSDSRANRAAAYGVD